MRPLAKWLKQQRRSKDWTVAELAHVLTLAGYETKEGTVRVWEAPSGRDPRPETIEALERIFGAPAPSSAAREDDALERIALALDRLARLDDLTVEVARIAGDLEALRHEVRGDVMPVGEQEDSPGRREV